MAKQVVPTNMPDVSVINEPIILGAIIKAK